MSARRQAHQIHGVRKVVSLVEIVDAPNQSSLHVPPGSEVLYMQVAYSQHFRSPVLFGAGIGPELHPPVKGRSQKWEDVLRHGGMFALQVRCEQRDPLTQPSFVALGGLRDVHLTSSVRRCTCRDWGILKSRAPVALRVSKGRSST